MKKKRRFNREKIRKGIYILPNLFTAMNMFFGFFALVSAISQKFHQAALLILVATLFDAMDGKVARMTKSSSRFGAEFDSLADLVSFGVAPAIMIYMWALIPYGRYGWLAAFLFAVCGALRLARFNTQIGSSSGKYFTGLPIPAGAGLPALTVLFFIEYDLGVPNGISMLVFLYLLSFLMVSTIPYYSFKQVAWLRSRNINTLVMAILCLILIAAQPVLTGFVLGIAYISSGPVCLLIRKKAKSEAPAAGQSSMETGLKKKESGIDVK